jgi:uncharacterized delta-60 repeat protein
LTENHRNHVRLAQHRPRLRAALVALAAMLACSLAPAGAARAAAAPGTPDPGFGTAGVATLAKGTQLFGLASQPDGQLIAAGASNGHVLVQRFSASGAPDGSYLGASGYARAVAIEPGGEIVIAGSSAGAMFAERLTSSLQPDGSFGSGGVASAFAGQSGVANGVAVAPDGSVVVAGSTGNPVTQAAVAAFTSSGKSEFANSLAYPNSSLSAVKVQGNGAIVLAGSFRPLQITYGLISRLSSSGALDTSFAGGSGAVQYLLPGGAYTSFTSLALQSNGDIVAGGIGLQSQPQAIFARLTSSGSFDDGFGSGGVASLPAGQNVTVDTYPIGVYGVAIGGGGTILGAGSYENTGTEIDAAEWALTSSGQPETAFGSGGVARYPQSGFEYCAAAVAPDGSLLAAGDLVSAYPDQTPCALNAASSGIAGRYIGYGPPPGGSAPPPPPPPVPALKLTLSGLKGSYPSKRAQRLGVTVGAACNEGCRLTATLTATAWVASRLHIGGKRVRRCVRLRGRRRCHTVVRYHPITVARASHTLGSSGKASLRLKSRNLMRALRTARIVRLTLSVRAVSNATGKSTTDRKELTFKS